jgi:organic hydroperoxide reductase OsmC/OhrA
VSAREVSVDVEVLGERRYEVRYQSPALADDLIDLAHTPQEERTGQARRLLCGAAALCVAEEVEAALRARGATIRSLRARATATSSRAKVEQMDVTLEVDVPDEDAETLERVKQILHLGCLITRSLAEGVEVSHQIIRGNAPRPD